jgi:hypothetical protein
VEAVESDKKPFIDDFLMEYLEKLFQDKSPDPDQDERKIWMNRGAVGVVRHLRSLHQQQRENMLGNL